MTRAAATPLARERALLLALAPGAALQAAWQGPGVAVACALAIVAALAWDAGLGALRGRRPSGLGLATAAGTGALLGLGLPADGPAWLPVAGAGLALALGQHALGGPGAPMRPALVGLLVLAALAPDAMAPSAAQRAPVGAADLACAAAFALGAAWLAWRGLARWTPLLAGAAGAGLGLALLAAGGLAPPAGALPALALGLGLAAVAGPGAPATAAGRRITAAMLGLVAAPLATWSPGLAAVAIAVVAAQALAPWIDTVAGTRRAARDATVGLPGGAPRPAPPSATAPTASDAGAMAREMAVAGARLGGLLAAGLLTLGGLEAWLG